MKISSIRCYLLSYAFPELPRRTYYGGERIIVKRGAMLIRVETDEGLVGYGTGIPGPWSQFQIDSAGDVRSVSGDHGKQWYRQSPRRSGQPE